MRFLRAVDRLPMAGAAQRPATEEHGALLFPRCGRGGTLERIHHVRYLAVHERGGREASPRAAIIDS